MIAVVVVMATTVAVMVLYSVFYSPLPHMTGTVMVVLATNMGGGGPSDSGGGHISLNLPSSSQRSNVVVATFVYRVFCAHGLLPYTTRRPRWHKVLDGDVIALKHDR